MDDESTIELTESDSSYDSFIVVSDDDFEDGLTWDSGDSRPAGPSPPSSANMNESGSPAVGGLRRLRRRASRRHVVYVEPDTQSDEGSTSVSQESVAPNPSTPDVPLDLSSAHESNDDSDETQFSYANHSPEYSPSPSNSLQRHPSDFSESDTQIYNPPSVTPTENLETAQDLNPPSGSNSIQVIPHSPLYSPQYVPHSPTYPPSPEPSSRSNSVTNSVQEIPHSPPYSPNYIPHSPSYPPSRSNSPAPHSPNYPPPDLDPDIQIIEPHDAEEALQAPPQPIVSPMLALPPLHHPLIISELPQPELTKSAAPAPTLNISVLSDSDEGSLCTICMDPLTNSGKHRVVCLRCGHIFGQSCVERWIKVGCNNGARRCPTCNKKACLKDIRVLYLPKVVPLDTVEKDRLIQEKEELVQQKNVIEMELSRCKLQSELNAKKYEEKIMKLEKELMEAVNAIDLLNQGKKIVAPNIELKRDGVRSDLLYMVDISKEGGCRVLAYNHLLQELVVSQPSGNTIFAGYGVRVLNTVDFSPCRFVYLHQKMIRDLAFHAEDRDLLLSASLDHTAKLLDLASSTTVHTFKAGEGPLWSCCWDATNPHLLLVGSQLGKVCQYDRRMMDHHINLWEDMNNHTPVVALASVPSVARTPFPQGGFLSCRLNGVFAFMRHGDKYKSQELQLEGPFMSMRYDYTTQSLLTTSRPSSRCPYARISLNLVDLDQTGNVCIPQIHTFNCGSSARVLSRLTTLPALNDSLVVAHHESGRTVNMWSTKTGDLVHSFPIREPVIDLTSINITNNKCLLATLSDKKVSIYKVT